MKHNQNWDEKLPDIGLSNTDCVLLIATQNITLYSSVSVRFSKNIVGEGRTFVTHNSKRDLIGTPR